MLMTYLKTIIEGINGVPVLAAPMKTFQFIASLRETLLVLLESMLSSNDMPIPDLIEMECKSKEMAALDDLYMAFLMLNGTKGFEKEYALLSAFIFNHSPQLNSDGKIVCHVK